MRSCYGSELSDAALEYAKEVSKFGISCDTMASEKFHDFVELLKRHPSFSGFAYAIEDEDADGAGRSISSVLALMVIGKILGADKMRQVCKYPWQTLD